jgi:hypothetical protein
LFWIFFVVVGVVLCVLSFCAGINVEFKASQNYKQGQIDAFREKIHWRMAVNEDHEIVWRYFEEPKDSFFEIDSDEAK